MNRAAGHKQIEVADRLGISPPVACQRLSRAEREGEITPEAARERYAGACGDRDDGMKRRIAGALSEAGIERDKIRDVMGTMRRIMDELRAEGDAFELDPAVSDDLTGMGLTAEQIAFVVGLAQGLASRPDL